MQKRARRVVHHAALIRERLMIRCGGPELVQRSLSLSYIVDDEVQVSLHWNIR